MNRNQRDKNRANADMLRQKKRDLEIANHTCENCGDKGGHWISTRGISLAGMLSGVDDQEGFWVCPKLYGPDGRRIDAQRGIDTILCISK